MIQFNRITTILMLVFAFLFASYIGSNLFLAHSLQSTYVDGKKEKDLIVELFNTRRKLVGGMESMHGIVTSAPYISDKTLQQSNHDKITKFTEIIDLLKVFGKGNERLEKASALIEKNMRDYHELALSVAKDISRSKRDIAENTVKSLAEPLFNKVRDEFEVFNLTLQDELAKKDESLSNEYVSDLRIAAILAVLCCLMFVAIIICLRKYLFKPLSHIVCGVSDLADGKRTSDYFDTSRLAKFGEMKDLAHAMERLLDNMLKNVLPVKHALDHSGSAIMLTTPNGQIFYKNTSCVELLGRMDVNTHASIEGFILDAQRFLHANQSMNAHIRIHDATIDCKTFPIFNDSGVIDVIVFELTDRTQELRVEDEIEHIVTCAVNGDLTQRSDESGKHGFMLALSRNLNTLMDTVEESLVDIGTMLSSLAKGDLSVEMHKEYKGVFENLKNNANTSIHQLKDSMGNIIQSAREIKTIAQTISSGASDLSYRTEQQAGSLEETAASMEELSSTVKNTADNAQDANSFANNSRKVAGDGEDVMKHAISAMNKIETSSSQISTIISVIDEISFQTNLLALNAAVEASRAGEHGRGFAVVAEEVRTLAQRSASASKEIKILINESRGHVIEGASLVSETGKVLENIVEASDKIATIVNSIAAATAEQTIGLEQINLTVSQLDEMTQKNSALVHQNTTSSAALQAESHKLDAIVSQFKLI